MALQAMQNRFSISEYREWNSRSFAKEFEIGGQFPTVIKNLKLVDNEYGKVRLNESIFSVRPSTVRKAMNKYSKENRLKAVKTSMPVQQTKKSENLDEVMIMLEKKIREKILTELLSKLS
jgi:hypothetical protein